MAKIPFNIKFKPQVESGEYKVETRCGSPARVVCWDANSCTPVIFLVTEHDGLDDKDKEYPYSCNEFGRAFPFETETDLFIITPDPELSEFEKELESFYNHHLLVCSHDNQGTVEDSLHNWADKLLTIAKEELVRRGYVIEKKAFHDAVEKVDTEAMKDVSENMDKTELTEFEQRIKDLLAIKCEIFYNEDIGGCYDLKGLCRVILECARKQLQPEIDSEIAKAYEKADNIVYENGVLYGKAEVMKDLPKWKTIKKDDNTNVRIPHVGTNIVGDKMLYIGENAISISRLKKLPGFKEYESHE